ncbi:MAG: hypothetical protein LQ346_008923 [Caloplaca aetnensis]|nr:MAG: hypothetical protein LQ346_008923 [Caloplaca aetnensis]
MDRPLPHDAARALYTSDVLLVGRSGAGFEERLPSSGGTKTISNAATESSPLQADRDPTTTTMLEEKSQKRRKVNFPPSPSQFTESPKVSVSVPSPSATDHQGPVGMLLSSSVFETDDGEMSSSSTDTASLRRGRSRSLLSDSCLQAKPSCIGYLHRKSTEGEALPECEHIGKELPAKGASLQKVSFFNDLLQAAQAAHVADFESKAGEASPFVLASPFALEKSVHSPQDMPAWSTSYAQMIKQQKAEMDAEAYAEHTLRPNDYRDPPTVRLEDFIHGYNQRTPEEQERTSTSHDSILNFDRNSSVIYQDELYDSRRTASAPNR